jgi:hypothetical protein
MSFWKRVCGVHNGRLGLLLAVAVATLVAMPATAATQLVFNVSVGSDQFVQTLDIGDLFESSGYGLGRNRYNLSGEAVESASPYASVLTSGLTIAPAIFTAQNATVGPPGGPASEPLDSIALFSFGRQAIKETAGDNGVVHFTSYTLDVRGQGVGPDHDGFLTMAEFGPLLAAIGPLQWIERRIDFDYVGNVRNQSNRVEQTYSGFATFVAVPEPQSWTLLIVGFCLAGAGLRQRRTVAN